MAGTLKHAFTSAKADGTDATKVRASSWNADHTFSGGALGSLLYRDTGASDGANWLADVAAGSYLRSGGVGAAPLWSTLTLPNSATAGDLMYASSANAIGSLADVATGSVLVSGGVGAAPAWSATPTLTDLTLTGVVKWANGLSSAPSATFANDTGKGFYSPAGNQIGVAVNANQWGRFYFNGGNSANPELWLAGDGARIGFGVSEDTFLVRDAAANILALRNLTSAQTFRVYGTFTDASNYERLAFAFVSNEAQFRSEAAGTGITTRTMAFTTVGAGAIAFRTNSTDRWVIGGSTGHFLGSGATSGLGYGTGAGGTVTQLTSKATGVTLNKVTGQITLDAASLAANTAVSFTLTDSAIAATDLVALNHVSGGTAGAYSFTSTPAAGSTVITVRNLTAGALAEAIVIQFAVLKGVTS